MVEGGGGVERRSFTKLESRTHLPTRVWACLPFHITASGCCSRRRRRRQQQTEVHIPYTKPVSPKRRQQQQRCGERRWGNDDDDDDD
ncbi:hypothetical protein ACLKA6_017714 [Drosophila palustris]